MNKQTLIDNDKKYIIGTYNRADIAIKKGSGSYAYDYDNKEYIDFTSGIGVNCLGYADKGWAKAVADQAMLLQHSSNYFFTEPCVSLAKMLCEKTGFKKAFFANSGAEANECAVKVARKYSQDKYGEHRSEILTLNDSFHGRTITTLSATGQSTFHELFTPLTPGFSYANFNDFEDTAKAVTENICAVLIEMIQGEGGVNPIDKDYIQKLAKYLKEKDVLLIVDEVQTGVGRTGKFFSYEYFDIQPDIVTTAKGLGGGLPIGAILFNQTTMDVLKAGEHGSTFGGNPVACAAAKYVMTKMTDEFLLDVCKKGEHISKTLNTFKNIERTYGLGLMIGAKLKDGINVKEVVRACAEKGLLVLTAKTKLRLLPPLNIDTKTIDKGLSILKSVLESF